MKLDYLPKSLKIHWFFKVMFVFALILIVWVIFYYGVPEIVPPQRIESKEVYGLIFANQIWGGEIKIVGDIYAPTNSTVTILPGTKVLVAIRGDKSNMDFNPWHQKSGVNTGEFSRGVRKGEPFWDAKEKIQIHLNKLVILGEPSNQVEITSDSLDASPYDFNTLSIRQGNITNAVFSNYRRFEAGSDVVIKSSAFRNTGECSLCFNRGNPVVENNTFEDSLRESIWIERASPKIKNNLFINLAGDGIKIDSKRLSMPEITNNVFEMPQKIALNFISGGQKKDALIERNVFSGNSKILVACDTKLKIRDNVILGLIEFSNGCNSAFTFGPNFWGTPEPAVVMKEKILNKYDKFDIQIPNVLLSPPKDAGRM